MRHFLAVLAIYYVITQVSIDSVCTLLVLNLSSLMQMQILASI